MMRLLVLFWLMAPYRAAIGATNLDLDGYLTTSSITLGGTAGPFDLTLSTGIFLKGGCITFKDGTQQCRAAIGVVNSADNTFTGYNTFTARIISSYTVAASGLFTGSSGVLDYSVGVTSVTRTALGHWMVNLSTPFLNTGYVVEVVPEMDATMNVDCIVGRTGATANQAKRTAEAFPLSCHANTTGNPIDPDKVHFVATGAMQ